MKFLVVLFSVLTLAIALSARAANGPGDAARQQAQYFLDKNYPALWNSYSPRFREKCDYQTLRAYAVASHTKYDGSLTFKVYNVVTHGDTAYVSYRWYYHHKTLMSVQSDLFVRINGRWLDELDAITRCP